MLYAIVGWIVMWMVERKGDESLSGQMRPKISQVYECQPLPVPRNGLLHEKKNRPIKLFVNNWIMDFDSGDNALSIITLVSSIVVDNRSNPK